MGFWYTFGSQIGELLGFHLQASGTKTVGAAVFWSAQFLWFYLYFIVTVGVVRVDLDALIPPPVVTLVDPWISLDLVHFLLSGSGQRSDQRLVRTILRSRPGGAFKSRTSHAASILPPACDFCRNCLRCRNCRGPDQILRQSLHLSLAYCDERLLRGALARNYGPLREPPSVFKKIRCGLQLRWRDSASILSMQS